jgi:hypothetical protein
MTTIFTIKMGMRLVVIIWRQAVIKCPAARTDSFNDTTLHQQVKNAVDGHSVNRTAPFQDIIDIVW